MKKGFRSAVTLLVLLCLLISPFGSPAEESAAAPAAEPAEDPAGEAGGETVPESGPWTGDGHWYTFQIIGDSGLISSVNTRYILLYDYYFVSMETAVAIGRLKGMTTEVKVYTSDPEERVIWEFSPSTNSLGGVFRRSGYELPDPGMETGDLALLMENRPVILSAAAQAELYDLREEIAVSGIPVDESGYQMDPDRLFDVAVAFEYHELPDFGRWMELSMIRMEDKLLLLFWKVDSKTYELLPDRVLEIDPESELYHEFFDILLRIEQSKE